MQVGDAFIHARARLELNTIATSPTDHVFHVASFAALDKISSTLERNIIAIEGTDTESGFRNAFKRHRYKPTKSLVKSLMSTILDFVILLY